MKAKSKSKKAKDKKNDQTLKLGMQETDIRTKIVFIKNKKKQQEDINFLKFKNINRD